MAGKPSGLGKDANRIPIDSSMPIFCWRWLADNVVDRRYLHDHPRLACLGRRNAFTFLITRVEASSGSPYPSSATVFQPRPDIHSNNQRYNASYSLRRFGQTAASPAGNSEFAWGFSTPAVERFTLNVDQNLDVKLLCDYLTYESMKRRKQILSRPPPRRPSP